MINQLAVIQSTSGTAGTILLNGADASVDNIGNFNVTGLSPVPASNIQNVTKIPYAAEQIKKQLLTFTAANSTDYTFTIKGWSLAQGTPVTKVVQFTSDASATAAEVTALATAAVNAFSDFNVTATDYNGTISGTIILTGSAFATYPNCYNAPDFLVVESDSNIAVTTPATVTFSAPAVSAGSRTATGMLVIAGAGTVSSIIITDPGAGYVAIPTVTISASDSSGTLATCTAPIIFEGEVVSAPIANAGTGYVSRPTIFVTGTQQALYYKYGYSTTTVNTPSAPAYPQLSQLSSSYNYTEWIVDYIRFPKSGETLNATTTTTSQLSILVYESATYAPALNSDYGTMNNLRKGYRCSIEPVKALNGTTDVTTTTFVVATGVFTLSAAQSNGIKSNDLLLVGTTPAFGNTADTNAIAKICGVASNLSLIAQIGGGNLIAAITTQTLATSVVKRDVISL